MDPQDEQRWQRRLERERAARKQAESLLEEKSLELYSANQALQKFAQTLEQQVQVRTQELEAALKKAEAATRARSEFLAMMSHEIRTPMNAILGMAQLLETSPLNAEQLEQLHIVRSSGDSLLTLINDILDFSKIEANKLDLEKQPFDLYIELKNVIQLYRPLVESKGLELVLDTAADLPAIVVGDRTRLRQILSNLLTNAIKFTHAGRIRVVVAAVQEPQGMARIDVRVIDTGIGIPADRLDRLFQAFSQADPSIHRQYGGSGLGLAICVRLCQAMGGAITVSSQEGQGSEFHFFVHLPIGEATEPVVAEIAPKDCDTRAIPRVLVVDDNATNRMVAVKFLARLGINADSANDGQAALNKIQEDYFDIVLMDMHMPIMDGIEATQAVRQSPLSPQPYIIALTANAFDEDRERCLQAGMNAFLSKPLRFKELQAILDSFHCLGT